MYGSSCLGLVVVSFGFEARAVLDHVEEHLLVDAVHGGGPDDAGNALQALEEPLGHTLAPQPPLALGERLAHVAVTVAALPQVQQLQDVLLRGAGDHQRAHLFGTHAHAGQAVRHHQQVGQRQVLQAGTAQHLPLTDVHSWGKEAGRGIHSGQLTEFLLHVLCTLS